MSSGDSTATYIELAHRVADLSSKILMRYFRTGLRVETKCDDTPVTRADFEAEEIMRNEIRKAFPDHGVIGEELGSENEDAEFVWVLDPLDGTKSFINGVPLFGTLIGVLKQDVPWLGVINHPALNERWLGVAGQSTRLNGGKCSTRKCPVLNNATLYTTDTQYFSPKNKKAFEQLTKTVGYFRTGGTDCYGYALVASGWTDLVCEEVLGMHDFVALVPVVQGAGGVMSDWDGNQLTRSSDGRLLASGDPDMHREALAVLSK